MQEVLVFFIHMLSDFWHDLFLWTFYEFNVLSMSLMKIICELVKAFLCQFEVVGRSVEWYVGIS